MGSKSRYFKNGRTGIILLGSIFLMLFCLQIYSQGKTKPNILFLISDDLNDWIGCMGGHPDAITPNLDRLAERSVLFEQAHCPAPSCNPSRSSVLTGLLPSTTGVYGNRMAFRMSPVAFNAVTLPRYFSLNGYFSTGVGKITHEKFPDPASWDEFYPSLFKAGISTAEPPKKKMNGFNHKIFDWAPLDVDDSETEDWKKSQYTIDLLSYEYEGPFFIACGWKLPHLPWYAPRKYFELYDPEKLTMPVVKEDDERDLPSRGLKYSNNEYYRLIKTSGKKREGVQAYLACITFVDVQIGRVLDALDASAYAKNTIIVFWSDHGWHLGEKKRWSKGSLWEESTRAPLMISAPGFKPSRVETPVGFVDIYPTLVELAGLPAKDGLDGSSLVPLMKNKDAKWERPVLTARGRGNYSLRSKRWRYTRYKDGGEELYDHSKDQTEWNNLAKDPEYRPIIAEMKRWLPKKEAKDVHNLKWPKEKQLFWEASLKAAEPYHGKLSYEN